MGQTLSRTGAAAIVLVALVCGTAMAGDEAVQQDPDLLRFAERALAFCPDSSFTLTEHEVRQTPSGSYRLVTVERECGVGFLSGPSPMIVDDLTGLVWTGSRGRLKSAEMGVEPGELREFVEKFLPDALRANMNVRARVDWDAGELRPGGLIPMTLRVESGYGQYGKLAAVTADGEYLVIGSPLALDEDPVAFRRELLRSSPSVVWDHPSAEAVVEIVEFSDFECPGCRRKWPLIAKTISELGPRVQHGQVSLPLTSIHPWAFRAACAAWCVAEQDPEQVVPLKELFYSMQAEMEVSLVTPTAQDFVAAEELDEKSFGECYLRQPSLDAVHEQLSLGQRLDVNATPTYFVNGWLVLVPDEEWFGTMIERLAAGEDP
jgi:protein-disulfide isomerase